MFTVSRRKLISAVISLLMVFNSVALSPLAFVRADESVETPVEIAPQQAAEPAPEPAPEPTVEQPVVDTQPSVDPVPIVEPITEPVTEPTTVEPVTEPEPTPEVLPVETVAPATETETRKMPRIPVPEKPTKLNWNVQSGNIELLKLKDAGVAGAAVKRDFVEKLKAEKEELSPEKKKLSTDISDLVDAFDVDKTYSEESASNLRNQLIDSEILTPKIAASTWLKDPRLADASSDLVHAYVELETSADINSVDYLIKKVDNRDPQNHLIAGWVEVDKVKELASLNAVKNISSVLPPITRSGSVLTQGDIIHQTSQVRTTYGQGGAGMKIGVISDSVDSLATARASGDLPATVNVLSNSYFDNHSDEGVAMLEIIHDMTPDATLYFHDRGNDKIGFNLGLDALIAAGCNVIVDDVGWADEPFFEDGIVAKHVKDVLAANNIVYVSAAGNDARRHYQGTFFDDGSGFHDFSAGSEPTLKYLYVNLLPGETTQIVLQWNDRFGQSSNDYNLDLFNMDGFDLLDDSRVAQNGNGNPLERIVYTNRTGSAINAEVDIRKVAASGGETLEVFIFNGRNYPNNITPVDSIFGHPAVPGVIAVGAIDARDLGNDNIEPTSSQGPVTILGEGTRAKPDLAGIDCVSVTGAGGFPSPFCGTSAAAPAIAAIAAQLWAQVPSATGNQIRDYLYNHAVDLGNSGFDNVFGYGRADALLAFQSLPTITAAFNDGNGAIDATETASGINISVITANVENGQAVSCDITSSAGETSAYGPVTGAITSNAATIASGNLSMLRDGTLTVTCSVSNAAGLPAVQTGDTSVKDAVGPTLGVVIPVPGLTNDTTPSFTFSSTEAGSVAYSGSCGSGNLASAIVGNGNTTTFSALVAGAYSNCTITVTDATGNSSVALAIPSFTIDTLAPVIAQVTPVSTPTNDSTPDYTFNSNEVGTISYGGSCASVNVLASVGSNTITFSPFADGTYNCTITVVDAAGNSSNGLAVSPFTVDAASPVLTNVTAVASPGRDTTPDYTFNSNEAGSITYGGACTSMTSLANSGSNTVTFNTLMDGTYNNCTIMVTDAGGNASAVLVVPSFSIDTTGPVLMQVIPVPTPSSDTTPSYTFNSNEAGSISYGGACSSATITANAGNNTITFGALPEGTYSACTITVTDTGGNVSAPLTITTFTIDTSGPSGAITAITPSVETSIIGNTVTLTLTAGALETGLTLSGTINGVAGTNAVDHGDGTYSIDYVIANGGADVASGALTASLILTDGAGNASGLMVAIPVNTVEIDSNVPDISFVAPTKNSTTAITDTTIQVTDENGVQVANVSLDPSSSAGTSNFSCVQTTDALTVDCTIAISSSGSVVIKATDDLGNAGQATEAGYTIGSNIVPNNVNPGGGFGGGGSGLVVSNDTPTGLSRQVSKNIVYTRSLQIEKSLININDSKTAQSAQLTDGNGTITLKPGKKSLLSLLIPENTTVTGNMNWAGLIEVPLVRSNKNISAFGEKIMDLDRKLKRSEVNTMVSIGSPQSDLNFSNAVLLNIPVELPDGTKVEILFSADAQGNAWKDFGWATVNNKGIQIPTSHASYYAVSESLYSGKVFTKSSEVASPTTASTHQAEAVFKTINRVLLPGSTGEDVTVLQMLMKDAGFYKSEITGDYDRKTKNAVLFFQQSMGWKGSGNVGLYTLSKINQIIADYKKTEEISQ